MSWVALGSTAIGAVGSYLGGKKGKGGGVAITTPWDQMKNTQMGQNAQGLMNTNASYLQDLYSQVGQGKASKGYEAFEAQAMPWQQQQLRRRYFGSAGDRGSSMMGQMAQNSAMFGMNPKATAAQMNKAQQSYMNDAGGIDQYFNQMRYNDFNQYATQLPSWSNQQAQTTTSMFQPSMMGIPATPASSGGNWAGLASGLAGAMGTDAFKQGLGKMTSGWGVGPGSYSGLAGLGQAAGQIGGGGGNYVARTAGSPYQYTPQGGSRVSF